jgi:hypothetical protein
LKKKTNLRAQTKQASLKPHLNLRTRQDLIDYDYLHKLNEKELEWLNKFTEEEVNATFSKNNKKNLNKSDDDKRRCYNKNNARNRCILTRQKAAQRLKQLEDVKEKTKNPEEQMNAKIDIDLLVDSGLDLKKFIKD